jgi:hypothetical protein
LFSFFDDLCDEAQHDIKQECVALLQRERHREACERILEWAESQSSSRFVMYLPTGKLSNIIDCICNRLFPSLSSSSPSSLPSPISSVKQLNTDTADRLVNKKSCLIPMDSLTAPAVEYPSADLHLLSQRTHNKPTNTPKKRLRFDSSVAPKPSTLEVDASKAFTAKLQSLLKEEVLFDVDIGDSTLSKILMQKNAIERK